MLRSILGLGLALSLAACATDTAANTTRPKYALRASMANGQDLGGLRIGPATLLESRQPAGVVSLKLSDQLRRYGAAFVVVAQNTGGAETSFGPANVSASVGGRALPVYSPEELDARARGDARSKIRAYDRSDPSETRDIESASLSAQTEHSHNNWGGCPAGKSGCLIYDTDDVGRSYRMGELDREWNYRSSIEVAAQLAQDMPAIEKAVLRSAAVKPGGIAGGVVVVQHPAPGETVDVTITFAGQKHSFSFVAQPTQG